MYIIGRLSLWPPGGGPCLSHCLFRSEIWNSKAALKSESQRFRRENYSGGSDSTSSGPAFAGAKDSVFRIRWRWNY